MDGRYTKRLQALCGGSNTCISLLQLAVIPFLVAACGNQDQPNLRLNQASGIQLTSPAFLQSRAVNSANLDVIVTVTVGETSYIAAQTDQGSGSDWVGEVYIPEGSDVLLNIEWFEAGVAGLPNEYGSNLPLAVSQTELEGVNQNQSITIDEYQSDNRDGENPRLDLDNDNVSNLDERIAGSNPNDAADKPASVTVLYNARAPVIDGQYDSLWNTAQFLDRDRNDLYINKVLIDNSVVEAGEDRNYRWASMHDGSFLYLMVFAERGNMQTPFGDSAEAYHDDAIDIFLDGDHSKLDFYDGVDDYHLIFPLLSLSGGANSSASEHVRFALGDQSAQVNSGAVEFAVCLCDGSQQIYEIKIDLAEVGIPIGSRFGLDVQLNNDVDGGERDAKWAWHNDTGTDDTWRFPLRMGTAMLELLPQ